MQIRIKSQNGRKFFKIYKETLTHWRNVAKTSGESVEVSKKLFPVLIQTQMKELNCTDKITIILKNYNEDI